MRAQPSRGKSASFRTDRQRVAGLGTAGTGTGHWWSQRITSVALLPLTFLFIFPFASSLGEDFLTVRLIYANPFNAIVAVLFLGVIFYHLQQGLQVVIEDYIHNRPLQAALLLGNLAICWVLGLAGVFAVAKIAFAA